MIRAKREIVLVMPPLQLGQEFDLLKVFSAVIELEGQGCLAHLADHLAIGICVLLKKVLCGFLLHFVPTDRYGSCSLLGASLWGIGCLRTDPLGASLGVGWLMLGQFRAGSAFASCKN